jgi:hypothetical protein
LFRCKTWPRHKQRQGFSTINATSDHSVESLRANAQNEATAYIFHQARLGMYFPMGQSGVRHLLSTSNQSMGASIAMLNNQSIFTSRLL